MSIAVVKEQVFNFLASSSPEVLVINGEYGTGKTFNWLAWVEECANEDKIALDRYAYVSLFGLNTLDEFKSEIFKNMVHKNQIGKPFTIKNIQENYLQLTEKGGRGFFDYFKKVPFISKYSPLMDQITFSFVKDTIICIDDIERRGDGLSDKNVLGVISQLKEIKNCKIVLLCNKSEVGLDNYHKYREKVVDIELKFSPSAQENCSLIFQGDGDGIEIIRKAASDLNITNIRVLKAIKWNFDLIWPYVGGLRGETVEATLRHLVLFTWSGLGSYGSDDIPPLNYISNYSFTQWSRKEIKQNYTTHNQESFKGKSVEEEKWDNLLARYKFFIVGLVDKVLMQFVMQGYLAIEDFKQSISDLDNVNGYTASFSNLENQKNNLIASFSDTQNDLINAIETHVKNFTNKVTIDELESYYTLFLALEGSEKAVQLIDYYGDNMSNDQKRDITDLHVNPYPTNYDFVAKLKAKVPVGENPLKLQDAMMSVADDGQITPLFIHIISKSNEAELAEVIRQLGEQGWKNDYLVNILTYNQKLEQEGRAVEKDAIKAHDAIISALLILAKESAINRFRVKELFRGAGLEVPSGLASADVEGS